MPHPPSAPSPEGEGLNKKASRFNRDAFFVHLKVVEPLNFSELSSVNKKPISHRQNPFLFIWLINFALLK